MPVVSPVTHPAAFRPALWAGWAVAACLGLVSAYLGFLHASSQTELASAREKEAIARIDAENARLHLEAERLLAQAQLSDLDKRRRDLSALRISTLSSSLANSPQAQAVAIWNPETQEGVLSVTGLPTPPTDRDYQLWVTDPQHSLPIDGGVFTVEPADGSARLHFKPKEPIEEAARFDVSLERKGGAAKAEGPMVLSGR